MGEPLLSEGPDLAALIAGIQAEHGSAATIIYHDCVRRGGVAGFFAREIHRVAYRVDESGSDACDRGVPPVDGSGTSSASMPATVDGGSALDALLAEADARDLALQLEVPDAVTSSAPYSATAGFDPDAFAAVLRSALEQKLAGELIETNPTASVGIGPIDRLLAEDLLRESRAVVSVPTAAAVPVVHRAVFPTVDASTVAVIPAAPVVGETPIAPARARHRAVEEDLTPSQPLIPRPIRRAENGRQADALLEAGAPALASVTTMHTPASRARFDVQLQLRDLGVPIDLHPRTEATSVYEAVTEILADLPPAVAPSGAPGTVTAIVGELAPALRAAQGLAATLRLPRSAIWIAGLTGHPVESLVDSPELQARTVSGPGHAQLLRSDLRAAETSSLVVIATDSVEGDPDDSWAGEVLAALEPDTALLTVDASRKLDDERARLARLDLTCPVDALAVHSARLTASPASVWDLGLPVALLDGRPATTFAWSSLLLGAARSEARHRTTA